MMKKKLTSLDIYCSLDKNSQNLFIKYFYPKKRNFFEKAESREEKEEEKNYFNWELIRLINSLRVGSFRNSPVKAEVVVTEFCF
jgi:hypothetical protein